MRRGNPAQVFVASADKRDLPDDFLVVCLQHITHPCIVPAVFTVHPSVGGVNNERQQPVFMSPEERIRRKGQNSVKIDIHQFCSGPLFRLPIRHVVDKVAELDVGPAKIGCVFVSAADLSQNLRKVCSWGSFHGGQATTQGSPPPST